MSNPAQGRLTPKVWRRLIGRTVERGCNSVRHCLQGLTLTPRPRRGMPEVFPWMGCCMVIGSVLGTGFAYWLARWSLLKGGTLAWSTLLGGIVGTLAGACWAMRWTAATPGPRRAVPEEASGLWDSWIDSAARMEHADAGLDLLSPPDSVPRAVVSGGMEPQRALVRPRVFSRESGDALPLEDEIAASLTSDQRRAIQIVGPWGSGKTTALRHLASIIPPYMAMTFLDDADPLEVALALQHSSVVFTSPNTLLPNRESIRRLAPWTRDESIEYLLARDRRRCASVMSRLTEDTGDWLEGIPELWSLVLDRMVVDDAILGPRHAMRLELEERLGDPKSRRVVEADCFRWLTASDKSPDELDTILRRNLFDKSLYRLIRHRPVAVLLVADRIAADLAESHLSPTFADFWPGDLITEAGLRVARNAKALEHLRKLVAGADRRFHPMAASLLHAARVGWRPEHPLPRLAGAYLQRASWSGIDLRSTNLRGVDLSQADLTNALLDRANLRGARLEQADLENASLKETLMVDADLCRARLVNAKAPGAGFAAARLVAANLEEATLSGADFKGAFLKNARFAKASLEGTDLTGADVEGADFSDANLGHALLRGLNLTATRLTGARFVGANLSGCQLEGTVLPNADFRRAQFRGAGLAEIEWEGADLRGADLREVVFHLGSSRSGLVNSPTPCEGSRTGFYTDDYNEQDFKSPEEIRIANLCNADLRDAKIDGVDFYLVDLRGALLDRDQVPHLRRCGAILETRA